MITSLRLLLICLFAGSILGQVLAIGVYATKFASGPEQTLALAGLVVALVSCLGVEAIAAAAWNLSSRIKSGRFFEEQSQVWLTTLVVGFAVLALPALFVLFLLIFVGEGAAPVVVVGVVGVSIALIAAPLTLSAGMRAFKEAVRTRSELAEVI